MSDTQYMKDVLDTMVDVALIEASGHTVQPALTSREVERRRLLAADLSQFPPDPDAFAAAVEAFDETRDRQYRRQYRDEKGRAQMRRDADLEALGEFLNAYLRAAGRS